MLGITEIRRFLFILCAVDYVTAWFGATMQCDALCETYLLGRQCGKVSRFYFTCDCECEGGDVCVNTFCRSPAGEKHSATATETKSSNTIRWSSRGWLEGCPSGMCDKIKPGDRCKDIRYWWVGKCSCPCPDGHHCHEEFCKPIPTTGPTVTTAELTQYQTTRTTTVTETTQLPTTTTSTAGATSTLAGTTATTSTTTEQTPQSSTTSISDKMCEEFRHVHRFSSDPKVERWYAKFCL